MKKSTTLIVTGLSLFALVAGVIFGTAHVHAQAATAGAGGQALEIGPPLLELSGNPGQVVTSSIELRDVTLGSLVVTNEVNDFVAGDESGDPKIILDNTTTDPYSMKAWVTPVPELLLKSREIRTIPVTITVPANASPGGYYSVIRFSGIPPNLQGSGVSLSASLGALILFTVNGQAKESMSVEQFFANNNGNPGSLFEGAPITFTARLKNSGNIHEQPAGTVTVTDMFNNKVATLGVNQPPHDVLPQSIRRFDGISLDSTNIGNRILFGLYHAKLSVTYGANKQTITSEISFWVIPYKAIAAIIVGLVVIFFVLRFAIKRYNRAIIARAKNSGK